MKLRLFPLCLVATVIALGASAGTGHGSAHVSRPASSTVQLTMLSGWPLNQTRGVVMKQLVDAYNKSRTGKVNITVDINPDWPALQQQIRSMISAGRAPNIFQYNFNPNDLSIQKSGKLM